MEDQHWNTELPDTSWDVIDDKLSSDGSFEVCDVPEPGRWRARGGWDTVRWGRGPGPQEPPDTEERWAAAEAPGRGRTAGSPRGGNTEPAAGSR